MKPIIRILFLSILALFVVSACSADYSESVDSQAQAIGCVGGLWNGYPCVSITGTKSPSNQACFPDRPTITGYAVMIGPNAQGLRWLSSFDVGNGHPICDIQTAGFTTSFTSSTWCGPTGMPELFHQTHTGSINSWLKNTLGHSQLCDSTCCAEYQTIVKR